MSRIYEIVDPAYAATCSDVTLCSNNKGFFKKLADELVSMAEENEWLDKFENTEDCDKVRAVFENKTLMDALNEVLSRIKPLFRGKDARVSQEKRLAAVACMQDEDLTKCLALASQAVLRAPMSEAEDPLDNGVALALALWVRSEVLLKLNRPKAALEDLKLSLKERLPARMRAQYYWRMGHCYKGAGEPTRAKVSYELAGRLLGGDEKLKQQLNNDIQSLDYTVKPPVTVEKPSIKVTGGAKLNMPALSKLVKIAEEEQKGRYVVANDQIKTGDVILVDKPYAACLLSDYYGSHCLHCFKRLSDFEDEAPVWCSRCSAVAFCSVRCRDEALSTYHLFECQFQDILIGSGMSILSHVALRMVTQAGLETSLLIHSKHIKSDLKTVEGSTLNDIEGVAKKSKIKSRKERLNRSKRALKSFNEKEATGESETKVDNKMSYHEKLEFTAAQIYSLCTHSRRRKGTDYLKRVVMSIFLTECLKRGGFFKYCVNENVNKAEQSICELITQNLQLLQFNAHEIFETARVRQKISSKPVFVAVGIYPTGALFNHECYPAVARYFDGKNIILRATRPLTPGEVVSENYGPHFLMRTLKERQRSLACRYWFQCDCIACREDWQCLKQMNSDTTFLKCPSSECKSKFRAFSNCIPNECPKCSAPIDKYYVKECLENVKKCCEKYQECAKLIEQDRVEEAVSKLAEVLDTFHEHARPPHRETHIAQESLRNCYAAAGNVYTWKENQ
ncbi:SET and MYND domain-containing protein 4 [Aricia agestis]|uniref:SET and MYND domain-containing protein 4 n=1 Tax=Aricia agestis TaxID=91739 RepID=UPI001C209BB5|nr:SET and MYND domain-containing protein 4 [Aricia agestis]